jgi:hypothetical protein
MINIDNIDFPSWRSSVVVLVKGRLCLTRKCVSPEPGKSKLNVCLNLIENK